MRSNEFAGVAFVVPQFWREGLAESMRLTNRRSRSGRRDFAVLRRDSPRDAPVGPFEGIRLIPRKRIKNRSCMQER